ncbi:hypothetical protein PAXINDRAFT_96564 [Paxillus involutus ATCC 200175]|nr:hypothetical protein PAXINDRAFT_96564 [Paxillus involutus ATCC 200175]
MSLLHYLSYATIVAAFAFMTLSLASGLLYISELIEEHSRLSKLVGQRGTYAIIALHVLLYVIDSLPLPQTLFSIICHIVYLQNFSTQWPLISLSSASFIASCAMAITNHFWWFIYFSRVTRDAKQSYTRHRGIISDAPGFTDIATFFGTCVWLVPLFLFLSLSANDNALPTSSGMESVPSATGVPRSNSSLFKSMFSVLGIRGSDKSNGLIAPPSPNPVRRATSPAPPSPNSSMQSPYLPPPPRSPRVSSYGSQPESDILSVRRNRLGSPQRSPQAITRATDVRPSSANLLSRQVSNSGRSIGDS